MNRNEHSRLQQDTFQEESSTKPEDPKTKRPDPLASLAWGLSFLMHPLLLPSSMFALILLFAPELAPVNSPEVRWKLLSLIFLTTFAIPGLSVLTLRLFGNISSLAMTERADRRLPFLFVAAIYTFVTGFFYQTFPQLIFINLGLTGITLCLLLLTMVSLFWKMSAHGVGIGGVTGFLTGLLLSEQHPALMYPLSLLMLLSGAVMWARLYLNHHTPTEVWAGWFGGFLICMSTVLILHPMLQ